MPQPFSFTGLLVFHDGDFDLEEFARGLEAGLASEGGSSIQVLGNRVTFRGLTNYRSLSPLANISNGTIEFHDQLSFIEVAYTINVDRTPFAAAFAVTLVGLALIAAGIRQFSFFLVFGVGVMILSTAYSFIIQYRLRRWLQRISERILTPGLR